MESSFALAEASGKVTDLEKVLGAHLSWSSLMVYQVLSHFLHRFEETRVQGVHEVCAIRTTNLLLTFIGT